MALRVTLWRQRARDFSISHVGYKENSKPIVVVFVGSLAKHFQGCKSHSSINTTIFIYIEMVLTDLFSIASEETLT
jgi:hypothetical protein